MRLLFFLNRKKIPVLTNAQLEQMQQQRLRQLANIYNLEAYRQGGAPQGAA